MNPQGKICKTTRFQFKNYEGRQKYRQFVVEQNEQEEICICLRLLRSQ